MGLRCCVQAFSSECGLLSLWCAGCSLRWLLSVWITDSRCTGLAAPRHVGSSRTRHRTCVPCIGGWILNHWSSRKVPPFILCGASSFGQRPVTWLTFPVLCPNPFLCTSLILLGHRGVGAIPLPPVIAHTCSPFLVLQLAQHLEPLEHFSTFFNVQGKHCLPCEALPAHCCHLSPSQSSLCPSFMCIWRYISYC